MIIPTSYTVQVDWTSPTKREDGSELVRDEISGFVVSYGKNVEDMNFVISVDDPSATNTQITLTEPGMYYFSIIAIDVNGVESRPSTIQQINVGQ